MRTFEYDSGLVLPDMVSWVRDHVGPGRFRYIWGGMDWVVFFDGATMQLGDYLTWDGEEMILERRVDFNESDC